MVNEWIETREAFTSWVATTELRSLLEKEKDFQWSGMSLWWAINITQKDNFQDDGWYKKLHEALKAHKKNTLTNFSQFKISACNSGQNIFHLVKRLFLKIMLTLFAKNINELNGQKIWFHSLIYNLKEDNGNVTDRLYCEAPDLADIYGERSAYIVKYFSSGKFSIKKFLNEIKKFENLKYDKIICDRYIGFLAIFRIYILAYKAKKSLLRVLRGQDLTKLFDIDGLDASSILLPYIIDSFNGKIQDSLMYAESMKNALSRVAPKGGIMVTYGEMLPMFKPVCHAVHMLSNPIQIVAVQHAYSNKNKLASYYRRVELCGDSKSKFLSYSPRPDLYLVQGRQYAEILSEFFDNDRIKIIGCLKFDNLFKVAAKFNGLSKFKNKKKLLIAPSLWDESEIQMVLKESKEARKCCIIYSPHPLSADEDLRNFLVKFAGDNYIEVKNFNTINLIGEVDLVLTGYSSIAIEARIFNVDSVRVYSSGNPPQIDENDPIPLINSGCELDQYILGGSVKELLSENIKIIESIFHKVDGNSKYRMWEEINAYRKKEGLNA